MSMLARKRVCNVDEYTKNHLARIQTFMAVYGRYIDGALNGHISEIKLAELMTQIIVSIDSGFLDDVKELEKYLYHQADKKGEFDHE